MGQSKRSRATQPIPAEISEAVNGVTRRLTPLEAQAPTPDVHLDIFVAPDGNEFFTIQTDPGNVLSGTERRVAP
jgi:hypothetical protein